jgi:hypothetical protein
MDFRRQSIIVVDKQGNELQQFGKKGSGGPGDFRQLLMYSVDKDGVSAIDVGTNTVTEFSTSGMVKRTYKYNKGISRAVRVASNLYLVKSRDVGTDKYEHFEIVDIAKQTSIAVGSPRNTAVEDAQVRDLLVDGNIFTNNNGMVFRIAFRAGEFTAFSTNGKFLYRKVTIDETLPSPPIKQANGANVRVSYGAAHRTINMSGSADKSYLFVLSNAPSPSIKDKMPNILSERVVDVYEVLSGKYLYSFMIPNQRDGKGNELLPRAICKTPTGMVILYGDYHVAFCHITLP